MLMRRTQTSESKSTETRGRSDVARAISTFGRFGDTLAAA